MPTTVIHEAFNSSRRYKPSELMKRYPTKLELQKLKLEIEKLQSQVGGSEGQDEKIAGFLEKVKELAVDDS